MVDGTGLACLQNERCARPETLPNEMVMQGADGEQVWQSHAFRSNEPIGNDQDLATVYDSVGCAPPELTNRCFKRTAFYEGRIDQAGSKPIEILDRRHLRVREDRRFEEKLTAMLGSFLKKITLTTNVTFQ